MAQCVPIQKCAPDGTPVLMVTDGAGGSKYYDLNSDPLVEWAGDPDELTVKGCGDGFDPDDLTCEPGDAEGTIKVGGAQFEAVPNKTSITISGSVMSNFFTEASTPDESIRYQLAQGQQLIVPGCSDRQVSWHGSLGVDMTNTGAQAEYSRALMRIWYSLDSGASWVELAETARYLVISVAPGEGIRAEELPLIGQTTLAPGTYNIDYGISLTEVVPGDGFSIAIAFSQLVYDAGPSLRCC